MSLVTDEILSAYVDGELDAAGIRMVEEACAVDPVLARRLSALTALDERLAPAFASIVAEDVPHRFKAIVQSERRWFKPPRWPTAVQSGFQTVQLVPAFAALTIGLFAGLQFAAAPAPQAGLGVDGRLGADHVLTEALNTSRTGVPFKIADNSVLVRLSFETVDGAYCRHVSSGVQDLLACNRNGVWMIEAVTPGGVVPGGGYREAAGATSSEMLSAIERVGVATTLDESAERFLIEAKWTKPAP